MISNRLFSSSAELQEIWDLTNAAYDSLSYSVSAQGTTQRDIAFRPDGLKMYVLDGVNDSVYQYSLSTAWKIDTASYDSVSFSVGSQEATPQAMAFGDSGTKMYAGGTTNDTIYQYTLSTAWDLSTASYASKSFNVDAEVGLSGPYGVEFDISGTRMYVADGANGKVFQYALSTAWDVSTASYGSVSYDAATQVTAALCSRISRDGAKFFILDGADALYQYTLATPFNVSTATYDSLTIALTGEDGAPAAVAFKPFGDAFYMIGDANETVYQYSL